MRGRAFCQSPGRLLCSLTPVGNRGGILTPDLPIRTLSKKRLLLTNRPKSHPLTTAVATLPAKIFSERPLTFMTRCIIFVHDAARYFKNLWQEEGIMRTIKKYANRKLYDSEEKKYISMDSLAELIRSGEEVRVIDNSTGDDITVAILSQLLGRQNAARGSTLPAATLLEMLQRGSGTLVEYARKSLTIGHSALNLAEDELDHLLNLLTGDRQLSESEGRKIKDDILTYAGHFKQWAAEHIEQSVNEVMAKMKLATRDQIDALADRVGALESGSESAPERPAEKETP